MRKRGNGVGALIHLIASLSEPASYDLNLLLGISALIHLIETGQFGFTSSNLKPAYRS